MQGAAVACIPPFLIDRTEVTNAEYWEWWSKLPTKVFADGMTRAAYCPLGWSRTGPAFSDELKNVPVLGVSYEAAQAYARAHGKRLPTPYEWCLAALGPGGEAHPPAWMAQYVADHNAAAERIREAHLKFLHQHERVLDWPSFVSNDLGRKINGAGVLLLRGETLDFDLPWTFMYAARSETPLDVRQLMLAMEAFSARVIDPEADAIWRRFKAPLYVLPAGSRDFDVSPFGVQDMLLNSHDYVVPPPFALKSGDGFTLYVNWAGAPLREKLHNNLYVHAPFMSVTYCKASRILQAIVPPGTARWLQAGTNVHDDQAMIVPLQGWSFEIGPEPIHQDQRIMSFGRFWATDKFGQPSCPFPSDLYPDWAGPARHAVKEIESAVDIDALAALPGELPVLNVNTNIDTLNPVGFRCAR